ncbi:hypothetical protein OB955_10755 [Halobacteria archaeon AArc-m2/3/4]|uniref:DUF7982 domain-containing protein n=1 Tax=Natronoglomus mannanivorans TaxID=2979990 RepID=A0ABT2QE71_9EURY|nr:hypothetical protein [Halobacteria archaeon AArc-m2/3/4]
MSTNDFDPDSRTGAGAGRGTETKTDTDTDTGTATTPTHTDTTPPVDDTKPDTRGPTVGEVEATAQLELLVEENRRLRSEYAQARQTRYRRTALGLTVLGTIAIAGGILFPDGRQVLFALAGTGLFGGLLTYYLTPGQFVAAEVGERVYGAAATNEAALVSELGLREDRIYLPGNGTIPARLFVPQYLEYDYPDDLTAPIVTEGNQRGLVLEATGAGLFEEFERTLATDLATDPTPLSNQLTDAIVEQFELAQRATPDVDTEDGRLTVAVSGSAFGAVDRFDHPIASFLAVGLAVGLDTPVELEVARGDDRADWLITCRWVDENREQ